MAEVILGRAGSEVVVDLDVCVKTGRPTRNRVTVRGSTTPGWVTLLLLCSIIGFLLAGLMTTRRYRVTIPFDHARYDVWLRNKMLALLTGLVGIGSLVAAGTFGYDFRGVLGGFGTVVLLGATAAGAWNAWVNHVGFHVSRDGDLVLTRAHPAFAEAARTAVVETVRRPR